MVVEERGFVQSAMKRKNNWIGLGHVVRGNSLLKNVIEGRMVGKKPRGRPRMDIIDDLKEGCYAELKRRTEDREKWRS